MSKRYYVLAVTTNSNGTETRNFNPYENYETALRKFYEPLGSIGAGPTKICVMLLDEYFDVLEKKVWEQVYSNTLVEPIVNPDFIPVTD